MKKFTVILCLIVVGITLLASCSGDHSFDKSLVGQEVKIEYATYARVETDKSFPGIYLIEGSTVTLTGSFYKSDCLFTTCECGGPIRWAQVVVNGEVRWIPEEAISY